MKRALVQHCMSFIETAASVPNTLAAHPKKKRIEKSWGSDHESRNPAPAVERTPLVTHTFALLSYLHCYTVWITWLFWWDWTLAEAFVTGHNLSVCEHWCARFRSAFSRPIGGRFLLARAESPHNRMKSDKRSTGMTKTHVHMNKFIHYIWINCTS